MGRVAFVSPNLMEALTIFRSLSPIVIDALGEEEDQTSEFEELASMALGLQDPFDLDIQALDHDLLELFWTTVEALREEMFYRKLVRGTLSSIKLINLSGLVLVEFQEFQHPWLHKTSWLSSLSSVSRYTLPQY